jgi:16S rRNA (guanine527-N7)-methyltransferase
MLPSASPTHGAADPTRRVDAREPTFVVGQDLIHAPTRSAMSAVEQALDAALRRHGVSIEARGPLNTLLELLAHSDAPTSVHDPAKGVDVHIADSLTGLEIAEVQTARLIADIGSGAGLPGLVLAAALRDAHVILVEAAARKCDFMRSAAVAMGLANVDVVWSRAEAWSDGLGRCDVVCARALATLPVLCEYAAPLLRDSGLLVAWKGAIAEAEATDGAAAAAQLGLEPDVPRSVAPFPGSARRTLHVLRKVGPTPPKYPRRPGIAAKRPLTARNLR